MPFRKPTVAYTAANSLEAHFLCGLLQNCGIEAIVIEQMSHHGEMESTILIERDQVELAKPVFADFEARIAERHQAANTGHRHPTDATLLVACEECGVESAFPAAQYGLVQRCPQCRAYIDVGDDAFDDWDDWDVQPE